MGMLKIQVNGKGMIPRGYGIAPRKEPFPVTDMYFIDLILKTPGLSVKFINPVTKKLDDITKKNLKKVWDTYSDYNPNNQESMKLNPVSPIFTNPDCVNIIPDVHQSVEPAANIDNYTDDKMSNNDFSTVTQNTKNEDPMETNQSDQSDVKNENHVTQDNHNKNGKNNKKHY